MLFKKIQQLAQWIGFLAIAGLALYGLVTIGSERLWAAGDEARSTETNAQITIPSTFNYQGFLRDPQGIAMSGPYTITIKLWTDVTAGTELYDETFKNVSVRDGLFNVVMGSTKTMSPSYFQNVVPLYVGVAVNSDPELLPRQRFYPVPWALLASSAQTADTAGTLSPGATVQNPTHMGPLSFNDTKHKIDTVLDQFTNGDVLRFFGPVGFSWVGSDKNQYLMHLNDTTGLQVSGALGTSGDISTNGDINVAGAGVVVGLEHDLMIVRGSGSANVTVGTTYAPGTGAGFTYQKDSQGVVDVTFDTPFAGVPTITSNARTFSGVQIFTQLEGLGGGDATSPSAAGFRIIMWDKLGNLRNWPFDFIAIGPRPGSAITAAANSVQELPPGADTGAPADTAGQ